MNDMNMMGQPDDHEAAMARADLYKLANYSFKLFKMIKDGQELEGWVQAKITKAADYIASVYHYMEYEMKFSEYGEKLETADVYTESVKREYMRKLTEARVKLEKLREKNKKDLDEGWEDMMKDVEKRSKEEKGTGKFDKKKTGTGTVYTRKSSTFDDGGKDSDVKKAEKKAKSVKEEAKKVDVPAYKRKAAGGDWKVTQKDLDKDDEKNLSSKAGLAKRKQELGMKESEDKKCNHSPKGKPCPVHGLKECGTMESVVAERAKPSAGMSKPEKSAVIKKAKAGGDIGKPGKGFAKVEKAAKAGGAKDPKAVAAAAMWKAQAKK